MSDMSGNFSSFPGRISPDVGAAGGFSPCVSTPMSPGEDYSMPRPSSSVSVSFKAVKRKNFFRSEVRTMTLDSAKNLLSSADERGKLHKPITISRVSDVVADAHHPLRLLISIKGQSKPQELDFASESELNRFIDVIRSQKRLTEPSFETNDDSNVSIFSKSFPDLKSSIAPGSGFSNSFLGPLPSFDSKPAVKKKSDAYAQHHLRNEHSLRKELHTSVEIHNRDPTDLFTGSKLVAELSGGTIVAAFVKGDVSGRAAIKQLMLSSGETCVEERADLVKNFMNEVYSLGHSHHPNVVELFEGYAWDDDQGNRHVWMVMEYMTYMSLTTCLEEGWRKWDAHTEREGVVAYVVREVCNGLAYLHSHNRVHRDIKSDNIFVSEGGRVKIGDLGCCVHLTEEHSKRHSIRGTPNWLAPECIMQTLYDAKVDVWAMGITLVEMLEQDPPYFELDYLVAMQKIISSGCPPLRDPPRWSDHLKDFHRACTEMAPERRADSMQLVDHPFVELAVSSAVFEALVRDCHNLPPLAVHGHQPTLHHVSTLPS